MLLPPVIMKMPYVFWKEELAVEIGIIAMCIGLALPCALALLPEEMKWCKRLGEEFQNLKDKDGKKSNFYMQRKVYKITVWKRTANTQVLYREMMFY